MEDGILITRTQINEWSRYELSDDQLDRLEECIPHSSIPDAINTIAEQLRDDDQETE